MPITLSDSPRKAPRLEPGSFTSDPGHQRPAYYPANPGAPVPRGLTSPSWVFGCVVSGATASHFKGAEVTAKGQSEGMAVNNQRAPCLVLQLSWRMWPLDISPCREGVYKCWPLPGGGCSVPHPRRRSRPGWGSVYLHLVNRVGQRHGAGGWARQEKSADNDTINQNLISFFYVLHDTYILYFTIPILHLDRSITLTVKKS